MVWTKRGGTAAGGGVHGVRHGRLPAAEAIRARQVVDIDRVTSLERSDSTEFERMVAPDPGQARDGIDSTVGVIRASRGTTDAGSAGDGIVETSQQRKGSR